MEFLIILIPLLLLWMHWRWTRRRMIQLASLLPGPPTVPILGNALLFMAEPEKLLQIITNVCKEYGQYLKLWLGPELNIIVTNSSDVRLLLTSNKVNQKGPVYDFMVPFIGRGILSGGPSWRNNRKIVNPTYNKKTVEHFSQVFNDEGEELAKALGRKDPSQTFDVYNDVVHCTTQCVCQTLMGLSKVDSQNIKCLDEVVIQTPSFYLLIFEKMTRWWLQIPLIYWIWGGPKKEMHISTIINNMTSDILLKRRKELDSNKPSGNIMSIIDRFIHAGLSEPEVKLQMFVLFSTSQEAAAKIASAVLLFLAHLPEWQGKVYNEIKNLDTTENLTDEQLRKLESLDMVYKEVLRYLSIAAMIQRTVEQEITINNGTITLPVGTSLIIPIHTIHRDPQYWDEPDKVKPERFLPENVKKRDPNVFIPFSLGAMDCLGRVYATAMIKTLVVKVLREIELEADGKLEDLDLHVAISVKFAKGYNLRVRPRKQINKI